MAQDQRDQKTGTEKKDYEQPDSRAADDLIVVGMGASAGGLDAFKKFFGAMPDGANLAFVLIQHLDPTHESMMVDLLARHTPMKVVQVEQDMTIEAGHVYMIPPGRFLMVSGNVLVVTTPKERRGMRMPVDYFLISLAESKKEKAIGIILSGTASDGTIGIKAIKAHGGMTMAQDPATALYDGMPRSALATGVVDHRLPVERMPDAITAYIAHDYVIGGKSTEEPLPGPDQQDLGEILGSVRQHAGVDVTHYKKSTVLRRIHRRMGLHQIHDLSDYAAYIRRTPQEATSLFKDMLIGVTTFFRDAESFETLSEMVIPELLRFDPGHPLRIWVPGCSTGEEPYSVAMIMLEQISRLRSAHQLQIFATDIDHESLERARGAVYPASIAADVTPGRLDEFFTKVGDSYRVQRRVRDVVTFAPQNLINDPPFSKMDMIVCRNLLIYLEPEMQSKVVSLFHFALNPGGYLFLGNSETIGGGEIDLFTRVSKNSKIYRRLSPLRSTGVEFPIFRSTRRRPQVDAPLGPVSQEPSAGDVLQGFLMEHHTPPAILVNSKYEIMYIHGRGAEFLKVPSGEPTRDLLSLVPDGWRGRLRAAIYKASRSGKKSTVRVASAKKKDPEIRINVDPLPTKNSEGLMVLTINELRVSQNTLAELSVADDTVTNQLESELRLTREDLQSTIEQMETSNEELKASNEEVMSMNEELQSTNEELETSKEELQSLNEELTTVNNQLQEKVQELETANTDLANLLSSTDVATLFLDRHLRIKRFTPAMTSLMNVIETDLGRPLGDITRRFADPDLIQDVERVLSDGETNERNVDSEGRHYVRRALPYRSLENEIAGVVVTLLDVTALKKAYTALQSANEELEERVAERSALVLLLQQIAVVSNESEDAESAYRATLQRLCAHLASSVGHVYVSPGEESEFEDAGIWVGDDDVVSALSSIQPRVLQRRTGIAGESIAKLSTGIETIGLDGLSAGRSELPKFVHVLVIPVIADGDVAAVLELLRMEPFVADEHLLAVLSQIGIQLGRVVERTHDQRQIRDLNLELQSRVDDFETLFEVFPAAVAIAHDPDCKDIRVNQKFANMLGVSTNENTSASGPNAPLLPFKWYQNGTLVAPDQLPQQVCGRDGVPRDHLELDVELRDGSIRRLLGNVAPLRRADGSLRGSVAAYLDVTERKNMEEALAASNRHLEEFAFAASHDLQGPLRTVTAFSQLIVKQLKEHPDPNTQQYLSFIVSAAGKMERLIRGLLLYARAKEQEVELYSVDLNETVKKVLTDLNVDGDGKMTLELDRLPVVRGNTIQIEQIFANLLSNSLKYCRQGTPLSLKIHASELDNEWQISVADNGVGFDPAQSERIFRIFQRLNPNDTPGEGVGLTIVKTLIERHGGRVWAEGKSGQGATFYLTFPRHSND